MNGKGKIGYLAARSKDERMTFSLFDWSRPGLTLSRLVLAAEGAEGVEVMADELPTAGFALDCLSADCLDTARSVEGLLQGRRGFGFNTDSRGVEFTDPEAPLTAWVASLAASLDALKEEEPVNRTSFQRDQASSRSWA